MQFQFHYVNSKSRNFFASALVGAAIFWCRPAFAPAEPNIASRMAAADTAAVVISESWSSWTDKPLGDSSTHNKLSSRSRKSVEDILAAAKRRQQHAEQSLHDQASARADKLKAERAHEAAVRQRHDEAIKAVGDNTARKQAHAETMRLAKLQQQAERLKRDAERAELVRQRKLAAQPAPDAAGERGSASSSSGAEADGLIDLPWSMFGETDGAVSDRSTLKDNPLHAKLSARARLSSEEVAQLSQRRMQAAEVAVKQRDAAATPSVPE